MEIIPTLSTIIFVATLVTIIIAVVSYSAYKIREKRRPQKIPRYLETGEEESPFFVRYSPEKDEKEKIGEKGEGGDEEGKGSIA